MFILFLIYNVDKLNISNCKGVVAWNELEFIEPNIFFCSMVYKAFIRKNFIFLPCSFCVTRLENDTLEIYATNYISVLSKTA